MMNSKWWKKIKEIYDRALDLSREERDSFLAEACVDDADLRREVESLLAAHDDAGSFLQSPAVEVVAREVIADEVSSPEPQLIGRELANYRIISLLGRGGMGEVYLAEDKRLHRKVALKMLLSEFTTDTERLRRFEREARAASALNHPSIITIYEIGETDSTHYIVTEYVEGETLRLGVDRATQQRINLTEALEIVVKVAAAIEAARDGGIIHRDIKTENIT